MRLVLAFLAGAVLYGLASRIWRKSAVILEQSSNGFTVSDDVTGEAYELRFPGGEPVREGQLQDWLDSLRADPEITDEELAVAIGLVTSIRRHLN